MPHGPLEGDGNWVRVVYDQRVDNTTTVRKRISVYRGPKLEEVRAELERIVDARTQELEQLLAADRTSDVLARLEAELRERFAAQGDVLDALSGLRSQLSDIERMTQEIRDSVRDDAPMRFYAGIQSIRRWAIVAKRS